MTIGKRIAEAIDKMECGDPEGALFAVCAAIDATAVKEYAQSGKGSYKTFISDNLGLITNIAFGSVQILNLIIQFDHPKLTRSADGTYSIQEILYHAVRCGLYHEAELPQNLKFADGGAIRCDNGALVLPASLVYGLITAVVASPSNTGESTMKPSALNFGPFPIPLTHLWGRRTELLWLLSVDRELKRLRYEANRDAKEHEIAAT